MSDKPPVTTTDAGIPAASDEHSLTVGADGPILLQDHYLIQKMAHFNRERVPERVVHAKGGGAHGFFEATRTSAQWCRADFLAEGRPDRGLRSVLDRGRRAGLGRHRARPPWLRPQVLHARGQLRHGRQQHAGLLHPGPQQVLRLHPLPKAPGRHPHRGTTTCSGTSGRSRRSRPTR